MEALVESFQFVMLTLTMPSMVSKLAVLAQTVGCYPRVVLKVCLSYLCSWTYTDYSELSLGDILCVDP